jgi:hypothetical protein
MGAPSAEPTMWSNQSFTVFLVDALPRPARASVSSCSKCDAVGGWMVTCTSPDRSLDPGAAVNAALAPRVAAGGGTPQLPPPPLPPPPLAAAVS